MFFINDKCWTGYCSSFSKDCSQYIYILELFEYSEVQYKVYLEQGTILLADLKILNHCNAPLKKSYLNLPGHMSQENIKGIYRITWLYNGKTWKIFLYFKSNWENLTHISMKLCDLFVVNATVQ